MPSTFIPSETFKEGTERDWPAKLGSLDWDFERIVFTKRTLVEFLRYTGTSVDPNLNNIAKLPRYADFGKLVDDREDAVPGIAKATPGAGTAMVEGDDGFKPSRRVRTVPGGAQTFHLGDGSDEPFETAPSKTLESLSIKDEPAAKTTEAEDAKATEASHAAFKPSRTGPGGESNMANLWDEHGKDETKPFKPTRRVREGPGGADSISQIF